MKKDIETFLNTITKEQFLELGNLIMTDNIDESLELSCTLVNNYFTYIHNTILNKF